MQIEGFCHVANDAIYILWKFNIRKNSDVSLFLFCVCVCVFFKKKFLSNLFRMASVDDYLANKRKRAEQKFTYQKKLKVAKRIIFNGAVKENDNWFWSSLRFLVSLGSCRKATISFQNQFDICNHYNNNSVGRLKFKVEPQLLLKVLILFKKEWQI